MRAQSSQEENFDEEMIDTGDGDFVWGSKVPIEERFGENFDWDAYGRAMERQYEIESISKKMGGEPDLRKHYRQVLKSNSDEELVAYLRDYRSVMSPGGTDLQSKISWIKDSLSVLQGDGYNVDDISANVSAFEAKLLNNTAQGKDYAAFNGYCFQVKNHLISYSKYKISSLEPPTGYGACRADELRVGGAGNDVFVDYKNYGPASGTYEDEFRQQLSNYAKAAAMWGQGTVLKYVFSGGTPDFVTKAFKDLAKLFPQHVTVKAGRMVVIENGAYKKPLGPMDAFLMKKK